MLWLTRQYPWWLSCCQIFRWKLRKHILWRNKVIYTISSKSNGMSISLSKNSKIRQHIEMTFLWLIHLGLKIFYRSWKNQGNVLQKCSLILIKRLITFPSKRVEFILSYYYTKFCSREVTSYLKNENRSYFSLLNEGKLKSWLIFRILYFSTFIPMMGN